MQETGGDTGYIQNTRFYQNFIQQSIIGAIILSHLTLVDNKFLGMKIVLFHHIKTTVTNELKECFFIKRNKKC